MNKRKWKKKVRRKLQQTPYTLVTSVPSSFSRSLSSSSSSVSSFLFLFLLSLPRPGTLRQWNPLTCSGPLRVDPPGYVCMPGMLRASNKDILRERRRSRAERTSKLIKERDKLLDTHASSMLAVSDQSLCLLGSSSLSPTSRLTDRHGHDAPPPSSLHPLPNFPSLFPLLSFLLTALSAFLSIYLWNYPSI